MRSVSRETPESPNQHVGKSLCSIMEICMNFTRMEAFRTYESELKLEMQAVAEA